MATVQKTKEWVYLFEKGNAGMRDLLGGKGAGLSEMTNAGLPVPPGFTITTEACNAYYESGEKFPVGMWDQVLAAMKTVEQRSGKKFGDASNPLLVSVRSGARISMPGMMDTVLNLGLNAQTLQGIAKKTGNERFAYDAYRRFIQMFGRIVLGISDEEFNHAMDAKKAQVGAKVDSDLKAADLKDLSETFLRIVEKKTGKPFPQDPNEQLRLSIGAVFESWNGKRAIDYRNFYKIPHNLGTAVNIVTMVFGNMGDDSGTGVAFTRDPSTGEKVLYGEFLPNAQGEDVVAGIRTPRKIAEMGKIWPAVYKQFAEIANRLEKNYKDAQDLEFTVEKGKLYMLQTRSAKRTAAAAVKMAVDMANEGVISREDAILRVEPSQVVQLLLPRFDEAEKEKAAKAGRRLGKGLNASPGAARGKAMFTADKAEERAKAGERVILVRTETSPDDVHGMLGAQGVLTARGGATSHAAVVARGLGKPCVAGLESLVVDPAKGICRVGDVVIKEGDEISLDGATGEVFLGSLPTIDLQYSEDSDLGTLLKWANAVKRLGTWANADYPRDAQRARAFGAEGVGLCRTEHMFFEEERLPIVRQMILAAGEATRLEDALARAREAGNAADVAKLEKQVKASGAVKRYHSALDKLGAFQVEDFKGILKAMDGLPVIIRLLDPPLHEFLPKHEDLLVEVTRLRLGYGKTRKLASVNPKLLKEKEELLALVEELRESNPMLGLRGCRLGILYAGINAMQARAIFTAAADLRKQGLNPRPEVMVPLVGHVNELSLARKEVEAVLTEVQKQYKVDLHVKIGTMIELPRAALTADEIAKEAEFFSFGTNDLTQTTMGISRDDAEGSFLLRYVERGILPDNPFQVLDRGGVGKLIKMAVENGRKTRPTLEVGICGEHGGDPSSIEFCHGAGLNYVSCSPFRVPVARLAAAHAALNEKRGSAVVRDR